MHTILTRITLKVKWIFSFPNTRGTHGTLNFQFGYVFITILTQFLPLNKNKSFQTVCIWSLYFPWGSLETDAAAGFTSLEL